MSTTSVIAEAGMEEVVMRVITNLKIQVDRVCSFDEEYVKISLLFDGMIISEDQIIIKSESIG